MGNRMPRRCEYVMRQGKTDEINELDIQLQKLNLNNDPLVQLHTPTYDMIFWTRSAYIIWWAHYTTVYTLVQFYIRKKHWYIGTVVLQTTTRLLPHKLSFTYCI